MIEQLTKKVEYCCSHCDNDKVWELTYNVKRQLSLPIPDKPTREYHQHNHNGRPIRVVVYDSPFSDDTTIYTFCSTACYESWRESDEVETCEICGKLIRTSKGHHYNFRDINGGYICLACYMTDILANGVSKQSFIDRTLSGMFFDSGDLENAGYIPIPEYEYFAVGSKYSIDRYCNAALEYIDKGYKVVTEYDDLSIMGNEGFVSMHVKKL